MGRTRLETDSHVLASLALALVDHPRATLQELAKAIGISKATLYRFCRTREQLVERLINHSTEQLDEAMQVADLATADPREALKRLIASHIEHRELTAFLIYYWKPDRMPAREIEVGWEAALDAFFLRGQREGVFRIDIPAPALTEFLVTAITGLVDAERRGRVARGGLAALVESAFLHGASVE